MVFVTFSSTQHNLPHGLVVTQYTSVLHYDNPDVIKRQKKVFLFKASRRHKIGYQAPNLFCTRTSFKQKNFLWSGSQQDIENW